MLLKGDVLHSGRLSEHLFEVNMKFWSTNMFSLGELAGSHLYKTETTALLSHFVLKLATSV